MGFFKIGSQELFAQAIASFYSVKKGSSVQRILQILFFSFSFGGTGV
jgi:hypothetical protein